MDDLAHLAEKLGAALQPRSLTLALAESCTGGLLSAAITDIAGSSAWFDRGFVTYSNAAKVDMLGVSAKTLDQFGAVSEQTAREMAAGAIKQSLANVAISITGIAGPTGGTPQKPVGTVCFAWAVNNQIFSTSKKLSGSRREIRHLSAETALVELLNLLAKT